MLNVCCIRTGYGFGPEYVNVLYDMVKRNLPEGMEGRFICFTDEKDELDSGIEVRPLSEVFRVEGKALWLKLNWLIVGPLDQIAERGLKSDDIFRYTGQPHPKGARIVSFELDRLPHQCDGWVKEVWRIGGGTVAEIVLSISVDENILIDQIKSAHARDARWIKEAKAHAGVALIVAGGPSIKRELASIRLLQSAGAKLFALNNVASYLQSQGIAPDAQVLMDAIPAVASYVAIGTMERYYCSMCHPSILDLARDELILWNPYLQSVATAIPDARDPLIGGGSTIGTRAICLAYVLGYRKIHVFGLDSSYEDGDVGHAYEQGSYASVLDVKAMGKSYRVPPQLLAQAEDFQALVPELLKLGVDLCIHGDGLIPDLAAAMVA